MAAPWKSGPLGPRYERKKENNSTLPKAVAGERSSQATGITTGLALFRALAQAGQRLAETHVHYEQQPEYKLTKIEKAGEKLDYRVKKMKLNKTKPVKLRSADIYPMPAGMQMTFLDENTLLFGDSGALRGALDARDGYSYTLDSNTQIADMIGSVESGTVWSVLDQQGTQNMLHSALGDASGLADYDTVKKRIMGSRYTMNFESGVNFDLDVVTSDSMTATTLSSLLKAGMLYKKMSATPTEKLALDNVTVNSDSSNLQMHFKADDKQFQGLLHSPLFAAVSK